MSVALRIDLHVHSRYSVDSTLTLDQIVDRIAFRGLQGFALTDHNTTQGHAELAHLREGYPGFWFLPGVEISTREGHLLAYGISEAPSPYRPLAETLEWVAARRGIAVLAHPFRWTHGVGGRIAARAPVLGIESRNGRNSELANTRSEFLVARRGLAATGGSDAHELSSVGRAFTEFTEPAASVEDLLEQLRARKTASAGESLPLGGRIRVGLHNGVLRALRGFRPV